MTNPNCPQVGLMKGEFMKRKKPIIRISVLVAILSVVALVLAMAATAHGAASPTISTDKTKYSLGETMVISGSGFTANGAVDITVLRPDHETDTLPPVTADANGSFQTTYTPPMIPGRYKITATDRSDTAKTAATEADNIGYSKRVYNKADTTYAGGAGEWTTGNAGSNYLENQWAFYQYQITGVTHDSVPSFDVDFNHFQSTKNAIFVDAFSNFRACVDSPSGTTYQSGPNEGLRWYALPSNLHH
jgi:hypothetical protein